MKLSAVSATSAPAPAKTTTPSGSLPAEQPFAQGSVAVAAHHDQIGLKLSRHRAIAPPTLALESHACAASRQRHGAAASQPGPAGCKARAPAVATTRRREPGWRCAGKVTADGPRGPPRTERPRRPGRVARSFLAVRVRHDERRRSGCRMLDSTNPGGAVPASSTATAGRRSASRRRRPRPRAHG